MSEQTPLTHSESPWFWVMLSGVSIALHAGLLLVFSRHVLQLQPTSVTTSDNWVPITLWSATAAPTASPKTISPVPIAPQNVLKPQVTPIPQNQSKPTLTPSPKTSPSPTPSPHSTPNSPQNETVADENESNQQREQPEENNSDVGDDGSNQTGQTDIASSDPRSFTVAPLGFKNLCLSSNPDCNHPIDGSVQPLQEPTSEEIQSVLKELALQLKETVKIQTVIDVKIEGTAEVIIVEPSLTQILQGSLNQLEAEALVTKLMRFYKFEPPLLQGVPKRHDYTVILTITPS